MFSTKNILGAITASLLLAGCTKSEHYDVTGDPEIKFFTNNTGSGNAPSNSMSFNVVNYPDVASGGWSNLSTTFKDVVKIPVFSTRPVGEEVVINAELDNSLIAKYNAANNTGYDPFPEGYLNAASLSARIPQGAAVSADSLTIPTDASKIGLLTGKRYMAPIKLTTVSNKAGSITSNESQQVIYVVADVELRWIRYNAVQADAIGALAPDRSPWEVTFTPAPISSGSVTDGSTATFTRWGVSATQVDVNLQALANVTGVRIHTTTTAAQIPTQVAVYLSEDGISYNLVGSPLRANLTYASGYNYILFYKEIPAKYVRLAISYGTSTNTQNRRLTELDVYTN